MPTGASSWRLGRKKLMLIARSPKPALCLLLSLTEFENRVDYFPGKGKDMNKTRIGLFRSNDPLSGRPHGTVPGVSRDLSPQS